MPDLFYLVRKWWKQMLLLVIITTALAAVILWLLPKLYLSEATALRASSYTTDKASIFNRNIEALYSTLGSADDLDMIIGTAQLDTVYLVQVDSFDLVKHFRIHGDQVLARRKAAACLFKHTRVLKSGYGELKVKVWDKDREMAAQIANGIMSRLQLIHQRLLNESNVSTLAGLKARNKKIRTQIDSTTLQPAANNTLLQKQLEQNEELISEYELMVETIQPALLIVEHARPAIKPDKPRFLPALTATAVLSLLFSLLLVVFLERRKVRGN